MASYNTVITNEGAALLASVIANQGTLTFSEMRFSTTDYDGVEATLTVGTFAGVFITAAASASVVDSTTIKVGAQFDNSGIVGDHPLYSVGIVGTDGNTTALIAVCTTTNPDIIRAALTGVSTYAFNINLAVSSTQDITVVGTTAAVLYDTDIVNTLNSTDATKPLSANMGHTLGEEVNAVVNVYGAKNLLKNKGVSGTYGGGCAVTFNIDGSITLNGTYTIITPGTREYILLSDGYSDTDIDWLKALDGKTLTLSKGAANIGLMLTTIRSDFTAIQNIGVASNETANTFTLNLTNQCTQYNAVLYIDETTTFDNITVYPMLRDAQIVDDTYEPFAETNQQLTVNKANRADLASLNLTGTKNTTGATITAGTYFYLNGSFCIALQNIGINATFTEGTNYKVTNLTEIVRIYPTIDTTKMSGDVFCFVCGKTCQLTINNALFTSDGDNQIVITGLPLTKMNNQAFPGGGSSANTALTLAAGTIAFMNQYSTDLHVNVGTGDAGRIHWFFMTYLIY